MGRLSQTDYRSFKASEPYTQAEMMARYKAKEPILGSIQNAGQQLGQLGSMQFGYWDQNKYNEVMGIQKEINRVNAQIAQTQKELSIPKFKIKQEKKGMFKYAKEYLEEHKSIVMPVVLALLADHFLLGGAFRDRLKAILSKLLAGAEKKVDQLTEVKPGNKQDAA